MKVCMIIVSVLSGVAMGQPNPNAPVSALAPNSAAPAPAPDTATEWRPSGRLLLLPARLENNPTTAATTTTPSPKESQSDDSQADRLQVQDSGEYYVLLPDGRLQMVKYMTAPLAQEKPETKEQQVQQQPEPFAQFQIEYFQFPQQFRSEFNEQKSASAPTKSAEDGEDAEEVSGFEANLQYREVKPISGPIYAYNPTPLVRILRK